MPVPVDQIKQALRDLGLERTQVVPGRLPDSLVRLTITTVYDPDRSHPRDEQPTPQPEPTTTLPVTPAPQIYVDFAVIPGIGPQTDAALHAAGIHTLDQLWATPDQALLAIHKVTRSTISKIRAHFS